MMGRRLAVLGSATFVGTAILTLTLWTVVPLSWGWRPLVVTTGSMAPSIKPGDLVLIDPKSGTMPKIGDVVTYQRPGEQPITHRVVGRGPAGDYRTKGDANRQADPQPVAPAMVLGRARMLVPMVGLPALYPRRSLATFACGVGLAGVLWAAVRRRRTAVVACVMILATVSVKRVAPDPASAAFSGGTTTALTTTTRSRFYPLAIMAAGPVSYWRLDESSGTTRADVMGVAPLTCTGATSGFAGALSRDANTATRLPAKTARCQAASASLLSMTGSFTVMAWERATVWPETANGRIVAKYDDVGLRLNYMLAWDVAGTSMRALIDTTTARYTPTKAMTSDFNWHQIVMTWDGSFIRLFIDGAYADSRATTGTPVNATMATTLGYKSSDSMVGDVDEVAIFTRAISPAEIADLYSLA